MAAVMNTEVVSEHICSTSLTTRDTNDSIDCTENGKSRLFNLLSSSAYGWGIYVNQFLQSVEANALLQTCKAINIAVKRRRWPKIEGNLILSTEDDEYTGPYGLALSSNEQTLFVANKNPTSWDNGSIVVSNAHGGQVFHTIGSYILKYPFGIASIPKTEEVLALDHYNNSVVVFEDKNDEYVSRRLECGFDNPHQKLCMPYGIAVLDGDDVDTDFPDGPIVVITDTANDRLVLFRVRDDTLVRNIGSKGSGLFIQPFCVAVIPSCWTNTDDVLLAVGDASHYVKLLTRLGEIMYCLSCDDTIGQLGVTISGIAVSKSTGELLVTDSENHRIVIWWLPSIINGDADTNVKTFGTFGTGPGQFNYPFGITVSSTGNLWVSDKNNKRLCLFH